MVVTRVLPTMFVGSLQVMERTFRIYLFLQRSHRWAVSAFQLICSARPGEGGVASTFFRIFVLRLVNVVILDLFVPPANVV